MTGFLNDALATITDQLDTHLEGVDVASHPGRFTEAELGSIVRQRNAVRVAIEDLPQLTVAGNGLRQVDARFIAFVMCSDRAGSDRHEGALDLIERLIGLVVYARWGNESMFASVAPANISCANLYSGDTFDGKGLAWWAISWTQTIKKPEE